MLRHEKYASMLRASRDRQRLALAVTGRKSNDDIPLSLFALNYEVTDVMAEKGKQPIEDCQTWRHNRCFKCSRYASVLPWGNPNPSLLIVTII